MTKKITAIDILGNHPQAGLGSLILASDSKTESGVPHRALTESNGKRSAIVECIREMLIRHHISTESLERDKQRYEVLKRLGYTAELSRLSRFPMNPLTQKGNLAEIVLAEYLAANVNLPVYRLRYNPNVDQAMKGDDVLAFDLDSDPVRVIVGESKFRSTSSKDAVIEIVKGLFSSYNGGIPLSLQFVVDRLFEAGNVELGEKVSNCAVLFAEDKLRIDYVGMLMSDPQCIEKVNQYTDKSLHQLVMISFAVDSPDSIIEPCYSGLEEVVKR
jgi:hypothetical protein